MNTRGTLNRIRLEGFLSIREMDLTLHPLNVLIGPNGAGKSNLIKFFRFIGKLLHKDLQEHVRKDLGGADAALHFGRKTTRQIDIRLSFPPNSYHCVLEPTAAGGLSFKYELGRYYWDGGRRSSEVHLAKAGSEESGLPWNAGAGGSIEKWLVNHMEGWKRYHFDDTSDAARVKQLQRFVPSTALEGDAANLASVLYLLRRDPAYEQIVQAVRRISPTFQDFILDLEGDPPRRQIRLKWKHRGADLPFDVFQLSDGTLRFICLATLLLQPDPPSVVVLDEPELGLHPYAIALLAGMMRSASTRTQLVVATQSVTLANQLAPEDLVIVETRDNASHFERLSADRLEGWLDEYRMGDLWEKNLIGGTPG